MFLSSSMLENDAMGEDMVKAFVKRVFDLLGVNHGGKITEDLVWKWEMLGMFLGETHHWHDYFLNIFEW